MAIHPLLEEMLRSCAEHKASDLFIKGGAKPMMRVHGRVQPTHFDVVSPEMSKKLAESAMNLRQLARFESKHEMDVGFTVEGVARIRCNIYQAQGVVCMVLRLIPIQIYTLDDLLMPQALKDLCRHKQGLILVTGPTGCGKTTTQAAMLHQINQTRRAHIVTIEDPIEFVHEDNMAYFSQREIGLDTDTFSDALRAVVREAPDVILIGEMRDVETMSAALQAAETGHLVMSTVHTQSASETMERIINLFPPHDKPQICLRMSISLLGVISQKLVPRKDIPGRIAAVEVMIATPTVSKLIEEGKTGGLYDAIKEGEYWGMQTMNKCLDKYFRAGIISEEDAMTYAGNPTELRQMLRRPGGA